MDARPDGRLGRPLPPIDLEASDHLETATFALG
jgi:hypothetical protein